MYFTVPCSFFSPLGGELSALTLRYQSIEANHSICSSEALMCMHSMREISGLREVLERRVNDATAHSNKKSPFELIQRGFSLNYIRL